MNHIKTYESYSHIPGGKGDGMDIETIASSHGVQVHDLIKQLEVGIAVEAEHTPDPEVAREIALDHLAEDPEYYSKLVKSGVVDEPQALRIYQDVFESDWWDNDPNAPWNQEDREPEESMDIEYRPEDQLFKTLYIVNWTAILEGKTPETKGHWVMRLDEIPDDYKLRLDYGDDVEYEISDDSVANYATDIYKESKESKTSNDYVDGESILAPLDTQEILDTAIDELEYYLAPGYRFGQGQRAKDKREAIRKVIFFLERLQPNETK
jgi:hypothetical protein